MDKDQNINLKIENKEVAQFGTMAKIQMFFETIMSFLRLVFAIIVVGVIVVAIGLIGWAVYTDNQANQVKASKTAPAKIQPSKSTSLPASQKPAIDLTGWRQLRKDLSQPEVRALLGEPVSIQGGPFTVWSFSKNGSVTFYKEIVYSWTEPQ
ncbi:hypothetical protein [Polynucleobacter sp. AP-Ainpum-60-G11]|uniref:hypothetical protein n=1 Tax=Polynucleobacter sp. AP-Ainpum-60-G11 TaxID=2576926 RepID=UPI001BFCF00D|nr:hypothetical protein [Polynucleobacter sp. AP-Ainpum-60-G11]QWE27482.1 hypothetical protein FD971_04230 [Polynucleobacter sp. AP-Ainpum-60-G11]